MSTCSVSKGCFVFKPDTKKRKISSAADYFSKGNKDAEDSGLRFDTCQSLWKEIKRETEQLQEDLNKKLFDNLLDFLRTSHLDFKQKKTEWACRMKSREIPTAAVVLGVNVTDHDLTCKRLAEVLQDDVTPFVVTLRSKECPGIKNLLQKLMIQLMGCPIDMDSSEDEGSSKISPNRIRYSVSSLTDWYRNITKKADTETPCKKRIFSSSHWESPPVVVIFKDIESFTSKVLQDFIIISSHCIREFPLVLIFGIATSPMIIHKLLPHSVSSLLCIELFQSLSCKEHLTKVIDKLLLTSQFPFKLSEKVLQVLINIFLYHDFSVQNFIKGFQETVHVLLQDLHTFHENYFPVLCCLHAFTSSLPKYPLGKQIRELYCACLEKKVWETEEYESAIQLVRMLAKDELEAILEKCVEILKSSPANHLGHPLEKLEEYLSQLKNPEEVNEDQEQSISSLKELQKKTDLYHLQKTLLEMKESRRLKKLTKFEMLRFEIVGFVDGLVKNHLAPVEMQTLHEVMYFSAASTLREHLNAAPRVALHTALNNPYFYLKNESLKSDAGSISNTAPDICIAYKLHLECGRLINLVDWLEAFSTVVKAAENSNSTGEDQIDDVTHARFIRAVSELELLGFIKSTKQKTDHVARLTWGSC
ncbi:origin recognition complex subunit 3-like isoform X3 [Sceloporus undulatus]|uniref:origin recognition complex subunit 3-like isoform X3 n=1 Tax=Sceloporus undulatus TaxID=8520 RepID=UPI001C4BD333|nr:origin recognition complex subunit 3-like isoform X3 [Sceloporus undulatus]